MFMKVVSVGSALWLGLVLGCRAGRPALETAEALLASTLMLHCFTFVSQRVYVSLVRYLFTWG